MVARETNEGIAVSLIDSPFERFLPDRRSSGIVFLRVLKQRGLIFIFTLIAETLNYFEEEEKREKNRKKKKKKREGERSNFFPIFRGKQMEEQWTVKEKKCSVLRSENIILPRLLFFFFFFFLN